MPTYQYACTACGHQLEAVQAFTDAPLTACPECDGRLRKVFSAVGVVFKGSGFYRTDSRSGASAGADSGSAKTDAASTSSSDSSGSGSPGDAPKSGAGASGASAGSSGSGSSGSGSSGPSGGSAKSTASVSS